MALKEELRAEPVAEKIVSELGYTYVGIEFAKDGENGDELVVYIDKEGGITTDDCSLVSHALDEPMDIADPVAGPYVLVVSSPGIDRTLKTDREFAWAEGRKVDVKVFAKIDGRKEFTGTLVSSTTDEFTIEFSDSRQMTFSKKKTAIVRLHIDF